MVQVCPVIAALNLRISSILSNCQWTLRKLRRHVELSSFEEAPSVGPNLR